MLSVKVHNTGSNSKMKLPSFQELTQQIDKSKQSNTPRTLNTDFNNSDNNIFTENNIYDNVYNDKNKSNSNPGNKTFQNNNDNDIYNNNFAGSLYVGDSQNPHYVRNQNSFSLLSRLQSLYSSLDRSGLLIQRIQEIKFELQKIIDAIYFCSEEHWKIGGSNGISNQLKEFLYNLNLDIFENEIQNCCGIVESLRNFIENEVAGFSFPLNSLELAKANPRHNSYTSLSPNTNSNVSSSSSSRYGMKSLQTPASPFGQFRFITSPGILPSREDLILSTNSIANNFDDAKNSGLDENKMAPKLTGIHRKNNHRRTNSSPVPSSSKKNKNFNAITKRNSVSISILERKYNDSSISPIPIFDNISKLLPLNVDPKKVAPNLLSIGKIENPLDSNTGGLNENLSLPPKTLRCYHCHVEKSPEWRKGPEGKQTLCNACGLFYSKLSRRYGQKKASLLLLHKETASRSNKAA